MAIVLGLDAGGSKTVAAIADESGRILQRWAGPGFDPIARAHWASDLTAAVATLCGAEAPAAAAIGLPFHGEVPAITEAQLQAAKTVISAPHLVLNDVEIAYDGAFLGSEGVLILAGTGSMAWAKIRGESTRVGGWGEAFGDEGSAYWIGREALSLASQSLDGRISAPSLAKAILDACGVGPQHLIDWAYTQQGARAAYAALAETVSKAANAGDRDAVGVLTAAAAHLARHADAVRRKFARPTLAWSHAGSVFRSPTILQETARLLGQPQRPILSPLGGALWRAAGLAGWEADNRFIQSLATSLQQ
ncbi:N-acetylglucosamine kinase [Dongia rigui]|uniref:BadF/BadG/BcrA/BcrD ATPase family protein n=1 Tax=Dongia rigui TaxID=940149 RepID=A0ABU5DUL3_9PROT|nr:BadF/BadG/BcrA/BcrD ATPase family protein [Dongia rigui]MDY0871001.1 BadF/BadG/BcrA/BcrD ATPase family protein [Dongia rigui]